MAHLTGEQVKNQHVIDIDKCEKNLNFFVLRICFNNFNCLTIKHNVHIISQMKYWTTNATFENCLQNNHF